MNLSHHFLIAMPEMTDPLFAGSVTYILQHDAEGAMGVIINRPLNVDLGDVFDSVEIDYQNDSQDGRVVYHGGPISSEHGFVLHRPMEQSFESSLSNDELCLTTSKDILDLIATKAEPKQFLFCLGYSGWSEGQLENELKQNAWLTVEADPDIIFAEDESKKYTQALAKLGVDIHALSGHGGMA